MDQKDVERERVKLLEERSQVADELNRLRELLQAEVDVAMGGAAWIRGPHCSERLANVP